MGTDTRTARNIYREVILDNIEYVLDRMQENTTYVRNIKKHPLAVLYNAPATISSYYTSLVNHDMYGITKADRP